MIRFSAVAALLLANLAITPCARAQSSPSVDQLINSLKPSAQSVQSSGSRGIHRLDLPGEPSVQPATASPGTVAKPKQHVASTAAPSDGIASVSLYVQFATGSAELTPQAIASLDKLGKALSSSTLAAYKFRIEGHTDTVGSKEYNLALSERRAAAVVSYIEQKFGVNESRLVSVGLGSEHLLVPTPDQTSEIQNRRVQIINLGA
jgi:OOP family OmpA-OmpF porin